MEHRYYPRMQISLQVDVFRREKLLGHAYTKDMSLGGMSLQTDLPMLNQNDMIILRIWMKGVEQVLRGLVVHASLKCAGIMLIDLNKDTSRTIFNFLRDMEVPLKMALGAFEKRSTS